jgi:hypothetical protein
MPNCYCLEFSFAKVSQYDLTYNDCTGGTITETFQSGITYNICSENFDPITNCLDIDFEIKGLCINGDCPKGFFKYQNECDVLTIFPLGVDCLTQNPATSSSFDGVASLYITGGTPPYIIQWDNGNYSQTLTNLGSGQYTATVTDFYGDFTAKTVCNLTAPSPTPTMTPTPTPTPLPSFSGLCLVIEGRIGKIPYFETFDFSYNGLYNGKPTWTSVPPGIDILWDNITNQWLLSGFTLATIVNTNPASPPLSGWQTIGLGALSVVSIKLLEGSCASQDILSYELSVNNPTCEVINELTGCQGDGSIIFNIIDGVPPYSYSINGINFYPNQPIFNNLCAGTYLTVVQDASGQTFNQTVTLIAPPAPQIYTVSLTFNVSNVAFDVNISPQLPIGASVSFDITHIKNLSQSPQYGAYTWNNNITVNKNMISIPYTFTTNSSTSTPLGFKECVGAVTFQSLDTFKWVNITMVQGDVLNGTINNPGPVLNLPPSTKCLSFKGTYELFLDNVKLNNCPCCEIVVVNHPAPN